MITGQQARELLDGTTEGPWEAVEGTDAIGPVLLYNLGGEAEWENRADQRLAAAAPALAETVAWLYGREPDTHHPDEGTWWETDGFLLSLAKDGVAIHDDQGATTTYLNSDQAIEFARALIAAAEQARHE